MIKLEEIKPNSYLRGLEGSEPVKIVAVEQVGDGALSVVYKNSTGQIREQMLHRSDEARIEAVETAARPWSFTASGTEFKLGVEAQRIRLAHLFDPMMAVHTSNVEPLPHQITAVYEAMLPRQPLRFLLADDPGAGKTIMAGLLIKELIMRADAKRVLIVTPGSLSDQWQDELSEKFGLHFQLFSREKQEQSITGNFFEEANYLIARLDQLARNEEYQAKLSTSEWDLIIVDEAHKLSAHYFGSDLKETDRYKLGKLLAEKCRHFLLMTATPHNGKEEDFQLFLALLDGDRFYGKSREAPKKLDVSDMMRRMVKEELLKFDGTKLFPERKAYTTNYELSPREDSLYQEVTTYVREEMNKAFNVLQDKKRAGTVGFALTQLQRRLASSPAAIYESLKRRRKKLESMCEDLKQIQRGHRNSEILAKYDIPNEVDDIEDELNAEEFEEFSETVVDQATASQSIEELQKEIISLKDLEETAGQIVASKEDKKWTELSKLLHDEPAMKNKDGSRRKLLIFTEHRDTLNYLVDRISDFLGNPEAIVTIHGGTPRDLRKKVQVQFRNHSEVTVLIATDAAGEGVNLQNANLMVNYDLPWNPNRIEQRFGRIHRIGQTQVCHLWNMVAKGTREGEVFQKLFEKLEVQRDALGGRVFDVLGEAFDGVSLKELLIEAIRYGESPEVIARRNQVIDSALNNEHLTSILKRNALAEEHMSLDALYAVKEEMDKAEARKLQPYFIRRFFSSAFEALGGDLKTREEGRWEITHVPATIAERDRVIGETRIPVARKYQRICFEKSYIKVDGKSDAELIHPGHPLMAAVTDLILERSRAALKQGTVLVDPADDSTDPRIVFMMEHSIKESSGDQRSVSQHLQFVSIDRRGEVSNEGWAPHIDFRPIDNDELNLVAPILSEPWINEDLESKALQFAVNKLAPEHYLQVKQRREAYAEKVLAAVQERLVTQIDYYTDRYLKLKDEVASGRQPRMQPENAKRTAEKLSARLEQRKKEIEVLRNVVSSTPNIVGGALVIPAGLLSQLNGENTFTIDALARKRVEEVAMKAVSAAEISLGHTVIDVSKEKCGWDITARPPIINGKMAEDRHIEVKGRAKGQTTITVTANEIMYALNQRDKFLLAVVVVDGESHEGPYYIRNPFERELGAAEESSNYKLSELLKRSVEAKHTVRSLE